MRSQAFARFSLPTVSADARGIATGPADGADTQAPVSEAAGAASAASDDERRDAAAPGDDSPKSTEGTELSESGADGGRTRPVHAVAVPDVAVNRRQDDPIGALRNMLDAPAPVAGIAEKRLIIAESLGRRETLQELFAESGLKMATAEDWQTAMATDATVVLTVGPLQRGFRLVDGTLLVITESELFPSFVRQGKRNKGQTTQVDTLIRDLSELKPGDPVVHAQHGIGRYMGLVNIDLGEGAAEFLHLSYANDATLYVPVD